MIYFDYFRRVVVFLLGVLAILDSLYGKNNSLPELIVGAVMVGILPIENLSRLLDRRGKATVSSP